MLKHTHTRMCLPKSVHRRNESRFAKTKEKTFEKQKT